MASKKGGTCWAVMSYDQSGIVEMGETRADALREYTHRFGGNPTGDVVRIRWSVVTPAKKPAKKQASRGETSTARWFKDADKRIDAIVAETKKRRAAK